MSDKRAPRRSLDDWMELVTECRQSGLTDAAWCKAQGISPSCFYNAVSRLRKKACQIPDPIGRANTLDLTSHKQDHMWIVKVLRLQKCGRGFLYPCLKFKRLQSNHFSCQKNTFNFCIIKIMTLKLLSNHKKETNTVVSRFLFVNNLSPSFF